MRDSGWGWKDDLVSLGEFALAMLVALAFFGLLVACCGVLAVLMAVDAH